jgi:cell wall-associated NlpC family hydrolase
MNFAFISVPAAPIRRKARHQSEMVNQLLFGEGVQVLKRKGKLWVKVRSLHDDYQGWLTSTLLEEVPEQAVKVPPAFVASQAITTLQMEGSKIQVPIGSFFPALEGREGLLGSKRYLVSSDVLRLADIVAGPDLLERITREWLNAPYLWGGRTIFGVDCSGFVQINFRMMGIELPRDAWQQAGVGKTVQRLKDARCGDLAFFDDKEEIVHVGILLDNERIIHASGKVRIDQIDKKGIINVDTGKRTHELRVIKRILN